MEIQLSPRGEYDLGRLQAVADEFKLGKVSEHRDLGGVYNLNVRLKTSIGEYVLRVPLYWIVTGGV